MMDLHVWKQRQEEMLREARQNRLAKALRNNRKRGGAGWSSVLAWELKSISGRLLKSLRTWKKTC